MRMERGAAPLQTSPQFFEHFLAPGNPGRGCLYFPLAACSSTGLLATSLTLLLVNLQSMISKPSAGGDTKACVIWKVEEAVHNFVHAEKVAKDSSTG